MSAGRDWSGSDSTTLDLEGVERLKIMVPPNQFAQNNYGPLGTNIFVFHIPSEWDDKILEVYFEPFGALTSVRIRKESDTNRTLGFGFVAYEHPLSAAKAIKALNGLRVSNKRLKVAPKKGEEIFLQIAIDQERLAAEVPLSAASVLHDAAALRLGMAHPQVVHGGLLPTLLSRAEQGLPLTPTLALGTAATAGPVLFGNNSGPSQSNTGGGQGEGARAVQRPPPLPNVSGGNGGNSGNKPDSLAAAEALIQQQQIQLMQLQQQQQQQQQMLLQMNMNAGFPMGTAPPGSMPMAPGGFAMPSGGIMSQQGLFMHPPQGSQSGASGPLGSGQLPPPGGFPSGQGQMLIGSGSGQMSAGIAGGLGSLGGAPPGSGSGLGAGLAGGQQFPLGGYLPVGTSSSQQQQQLMAAAATGAPLGLMQGHAPVAYGGPLSGSGAGAGLTGAGLTGSGAFAAPTGGPGSGQMVAGGQGGLLVGSGSGSFSTGVAAAGGQAQTPQQQLLLQHMQLQQQAQQMQFAQAAIQAAQQQLMQTQQQMGLGRGPAGGAGMPASDSMQTSTGNTNMPGHSYSVGSTTHMTAPPGGLHSHQVSAATAGQGPADGSLKQPATVPGAPNATWGM